MEIYCQLAILQQEIALPFDYSFGVPMLFSWIITFIFCIILIEGEILSRKLSTVIYLITILVGGLLLGGTPNAVMPIQQILTTLGLNADFGYLLPAIIILIVLLVSSLLIGRIFCGFACPLGALQEILSNFSFKADIKSQKKVKFRIDVPPQIPIVTRWIFLGILLLFSFSGVLLLPVFNPFSGFLFPKTPSEQTLFLPFLGLILVSITSLFIYRPWCRFLCPFGAGSSLCSQVARSKYQRTEDCTECGFCEEICPTQEASRESNKSECYYCNRCIEICPHNAIKLNLG
ncbi:MAG: 4Fe-4S binding protein [Candidatus Thorarchaeota archaeon]